MYKLCLASHILIEIQEGYLSTQTLNALDRKQALMLLKKQGVVALKLEESNANKANKASKKINLAQWMGGKKKTFQS